MKSFRVAFKTTHSMLTSLVSLGTLGVRHWAVCKDVINWLRRRRRKVKCQSKNWQVNFSSHLWSLLLGGRWWFSRKQFDYEQDSKFCMLYFAYGKNLFSLHLRQSSCLPLLDILNFYFHSNLWQIETLLKFRNKLWGIYFHAVTRCEEEMFPAASVNLERVLLI